MSYSMRTLPPHEQNGKGKTPICMYVRQMHRCVLEKKKARTRGRDLNGSIYHGKNCPGFLLVPRLSRCYCRAWRDVLDKYTDSRNHEKAMQSSLYHRYTWIRQWRGLFMQQLNGKGYIISTTRFCSNTLALSKILYGYKADLTELWLFFPHLLQCIVAGFSVACFCQTKAFFLLLYCWALLSFITWTSNINGGCLYIEFTFVIIFVIVSYLLTVNTLRLHFNIYIG